MSFLTFVVFAVSLLVLTLGAELVVGGGARMARVFRVSPLLIGMTVVGFGTSAPELVVSVFASYRGDSAIAVGNVIGSNIFNILGILGPVTLLAPLAVSRTVVRREAPIVLGVSLLMVVFCLNGGVSRLEGGVLFAGIVLYVVISYILSRRETDALDEPHEPLPPTRGGVALDAAKIVLGLVLLVVGARMLVTAAVDMARDFGVSERVIALTLVSAGTSVPELATSLMAGIRRQRDIALGNILGSNVFNALGILGAAALARPLVVAPEVLWFDLPVMVGTVAVAMVMATTGSRITRLEGGILCAAYVGYATFLVMTGPATAAT